MTKTADEDLSEIFDFIALDSPKRAVSFVEELARRAAAILPTFPDNGTRYRSDLRFLTFSGYVAFMYIVKRRA